MNAVELAGLTKRFGQTVAVADLTLEIAEGEIFALVGPDGAGKTTTLRMLTGIMNPTSGRGSVLGLDTVREAEAIKEQIGYMSQRFGLYSDLRVEENLHFYADIYGVARHGREEKIDQLLAFSNIVFLLQNLLHCISHPHHQPTPNRYLLLCHFRGCLTQLRG